MDTMMSGGRIQAKNRRKKEWSKKRKKRKE